jgi:hypothetical protein
MLGRLRVSVADCITAYLSLYDSVLCRTRPSSFFWYRMMVKGKVQGRSNEEELAQAVKKVVSQERLQEDALLKDTAKAGCKV